MSKHFASGGRPGKGDRAALMTRLPPELAAAVRAEAVRVDLSYSDYIGNILAAVHHQPLLMQPADPAMQMPTST